MTFSDHVFFFSYTQPQQKGGVIGMWSDADALAKVNCECPTFVMELSKAVAHVSIADLIQNFCEGLKLASLNPKRFLLQTGAKHYGFHIGTPSAPNQAKHLQRHQ